MYGIFPTPSLPSNPKQSARMAPESTWVAGVANGNAILHHLHGTMVCHYHYMHATIFMYYVCWLSPSSSHALCTFINLVAF